MESDQYLEQLKYLRADILTLTRVMIDIKNSLDEPIGEDYQKIVKEYLITAQKNIGIIPKSA